MRRDFVRQFVGLLLAASVTVSTTANSDEIAPAQGSLKCDRACLEGFVDEYLQALVARDPGRLRVTSDVKFTENTARLNLGEALWTTVTGLGTFKIYLADTYSNQAGFIGVVLENGEPKLLALRLRIKNGEISEIETIITRQSLIGGPFSPQLAVRQTKPIWTESLVASERVSRLEMMTATNLYFEGMEQNTGAIVPFDESCNRTENGIQTTNNSALAPPPGADGENVGAMGCREQFDSGGVGIFRTPERRLWMVDEERGLVFGLFSFTTVGGLFSIPIAELFKIKNGRIYEVEAVGISDALPYGARSGV